VVVDKAGNFGQPLPLTLYAYRYKTWTITFKNTDGSPYDVSGFTGLAMSVRSQDQTTTKWDATNGSPAGVVLTVASNVMTVAVPENAAFFAALAAGTASASLYYEITGDAGGDTAKTQPMIPSSSLLLGRREVGT
jgi:hypothetical protein